MSHLSSFNQLNWIYKYYFKLGLTNANYFKKSFKWFIISGLLYTTSRRIYNAYFGPLSGIPGHFVCKFIDLPSLLFDIPTGTVFKSLKKMHDQYGSVIRVGPKAISIGDKDLIKSVLVHHDLPKSPIYNILKKQGESMFNTTNKQFHKNRRRLVSPAFSIKYLSSLEPFMASVMNTFINKINQEIDESTNEEGYAVIDIWCLLQHVAFDIIGETAFGQTFHMIENKGDHCVMKYMLLRFKLAAYVISYMSIAKFLFSGRIPKKVLDFLNNIYTSRKEENNNTNTKRKDILQALIDTQDATQPEDRLSSEAILIETYLFLAAGSETTSNTVGFAIIELLRHPSKLKKLYQEIDTVPFKDGSHHLLCHDTLKKLPYLNGVINETLRLNPVSAVGFPRYTDQDILLGEHLFIPKETTVVCNGYYAQLNDKYWPNASQFLPERWIPGEKEFKESKHVDAFFPFSSGSRNCIGKNFAYQEMRIIIASLLKNYEIVPIKDEMQHATHLRQYLTLCIAKRSFKIKIIKRV